MEIQKTINALPPDFLSGKRLHYAIKETGDANEIDLWSLEDLFDLAGLDQADRAAFSDRDGIAVQCGGWQSWSAGWELSGKETLPKRVRLIPELLKLTNRPGDTKAPANRRGRNWLIGHFIMYLRAGDRYLCIASSEGDGLPPVTFRINREKALVSAEVYCPGKIWKEGETAAELSVFFARGFFRFKDALKKLYHQDEAFKTVNFLGAVPGGYESWYNHYTAINEKIILRDLESLGKTDNLIKLHYLDRQKPVVFQIDDGWEKAVGEWEINAERFPHGLAPIAEQIEEAGYIPGLWLAPFLVTRQSRIFLEKPEWVLRDGARHKPVVAGFNHLWDNQYYCLDISRDDVLDYLKALIDRAMDEWGFRYLKLDFLYTGLFPGIFTNKGSPDEHYRRACTVLTARNSNAAGLPAAYLGCGLPLGLSYRHFPLSRIGADTMGNWDWIMVKLLGHVGRPSAYISLMDTIGRSFMNGAIYINDPDVIFLRSSKCNLSVNEKELIALVNFLLAGQIMFSDNPHSLTEADIALTGRIAELYHKLEGDEYGAVRIDRDVFRLESRSGRTAGIINLSGRAWRDKQPWDAVDFLIDHRYLPRNTQGGMFFAPHSITIIQVKA
ncbi:alpha-galactosidase [Treponema primitia]|uniref:glycoside hydrolase family 36 protein n=1 Tax=Treponema primitia TaxID=88058 RepID=UPI00398186FB